MFKVLGKFLLFAILLSFVACNPSEKKPTSGVVIDTSHYGKNLDSTKKADSIHNDKYQLLSRDKNGVTIYTVDDHEYIYFNGKGLLHNENCPNKKHYVKN